MAGIYLKHRTTKDLDLFWHERDRLGDLPREVRQRLSADALEVAAVQSEATFYRFRVNDESDVCIVDLVADPVPTVESPRRINLQNVSISVDDPQEILVNKLCALLGRAEIRDLVDVRGLLASGADLKKALRDAPRKDAGFSPLTLAWVLRDIRPKALGHVAGLREEEAADLEIFKERLIEHLLESGAPE